MVDDTYLNIQQEATATLTSFPASTYGSALLLGRSPSWEIKRNGSGKLEINQLSIGAPFQPLSAGIEQDFPRVNFGKFWDKKADQYLQNINGQEYQQSLAERLSDSPFKLHYYSKKGVIDRDQIPRNTVLTPLKGGIVTELIGISDTNGVTRQQGKPGDLIIGRKRGSGPKHCTTVETGSVILFREDGNRWLADLISFRDDLLVLLMLNATPVLSLSENDSVQGRFTFNVKWDGISIEDGADSYIQPSTVIGDRDGVDIK